MGKDLKGKELGTGINQRKDGYYVGRYTTNEGKRVQKLFTKLRDCKKWVADSQYEDERFKTDIPEDITLSEWYEYWITAKKRTVRIGTYERLSTVYRLHIKPYIANKPLKNITAMDCQKLLNKMADDGYKSKTICLVKIVLHNMFDYACQNDALTKNPCNKSVKWDIGEPSSERKALTIDQQKTFLNAIFGHKHELYYRFALQTGLRAGEIIGLEWEDVDLKRKTIVVSRTRRFVSAEKGWRTGEPKTKSGARVVPLTSEAVRILEQKKREALKLQNIKPEWRNTVFLNGNGEPASNGSLDTGIYAVCKKAGIPAASMHILRHTFATRCIEGGMNAKTLQVILGHSDISMTMNIYVHMTDEQKMKEICNVENALKII